MTRRDVVRTARAVFDIVHRRGEAEPAVVALEALAALMSEHAELKRALESPFVPAAGRSGILDALAPHLNMPDVIRRSLHVLADQDALGNVPALAAAVRLLVNRQAGIVDAMVTTAAPLDDAQQAALQATLSQATGKQVTLTTVVDPAVIGGVRARVGGLVFDGTLASQLTRLEQQLVQGD